MSSIIVCPLFDQLLQVVRAKFTSFIRIDIYDVYETIQKAFSDLYHQDLWGPFSHLL